MKVLSFEGKLCDRTRALFDSYLNNELLVETYHEVLKHLERCPECCRELENRVRLRDELRVVIRRESAPDGLGPRIQKMLRQSRWRRRRAGFAIAAALLVVMAGSIVLTSISRDPVYVGPNPEAASVRLLNVGLGDHIHCAVDWGYGRRRFSSEEMILALGPDYSDLFYPLRQSIPPDYEITCAHRCRLKGRSFIHFIFKRIGAKKEDPALSLVITRKQGDSWDESSQELHEGRLGEFEVAGFETEHYLAFVVSNLPKDQNHEVAALVTPTLSGLLSKPRG